MKEKKKAIKNANLKKVFCQHLR